MPALLNSVTFNVCSDNSKAAKELVDALKAKGYAAELVETPEHGNAHALSQGQKSPPGALAHNAPSDVVVPLMTKIEAENV
jgi:hypothetical protein